MKINKNYQELKDNYLFANIAQRVKEFAKNNPEKQIVRLGIGDVTLPLAPAVVSALHTACEQMGNKETFKGYGEYAGYEFLREKICAYYAEKGVQLSLDEVFVSDGAKSDIGNILDIFSTDNVVAIPDPVYPVYVDTNIMAGREIKFLNGVKENNFLPLPDKALKADIIYLCSPNNPTGAVYNKQELKLWVDYAIENNAVILFDAAYEAFVTDQSLPTSIMQIEGAEQCAIEFGSLSKTAGFTGTRCGYTIVPSALKREGQSLRDMWLRRQTTKFNGVPYIVQRGAEAVFSAQGRAQINQNIKYYLNNANALAQFLDKKGIWFTGGKNSPYLWLKCPNNEDSWSFFARLLNEAAVVGTPGAGFGAQGEGYFRLTAFGSWESTQEAIKRLNEII